MNTNEYKALSQRLGSMEDVRRIAEEEGYDKEFLFVIYTQRVTRNATKSFYRVKAKARHLLREWEDGRPLLMLAQRYRFPPVLMAYIIMMERAIGRKTFWKYVRDPNSISNKRLRKEIKEVVQRDNIYSPQGSEVQTKRGRVGEDRGAVLLDRFNISYLTEKELRGQSSKTPDFLLARPLLVEGEVVNWVESKANFGDLVEVRRNTKKQLEPYVRLFGPGMVVYWFGFVEDAPRSKDIMIVDGKFMEQVFCKENWGSLLMFCETGESPTKNLKKRVAEKMKDPKKQKPKKGPARKWRKNRGSGSGSSRGPSGKGRARGRRRGNYGPRRQSGGGGSKKEEGAVKKEAPRTKKGSNGDT